MTAGTTGNAFTAACILASQKRWCWNLYCTTCGSTELRHAFYQVAIGRRPNSPEWKLSPDDERPRLDFNRIRDLTTVTEWTPELEENYKKFGWRGFTIMQNGRRCLARHVDRELYDSMLEASLLDIAENSNFPDYLGILGVALSSTAKIEAELGHLTRLWCPQLLQLVDNASGAYRLLNSLVADPDRRLTWGHLEQIERDIGSLGRNMHK